MRRGSFAGSGNLRLGTGITGVIVAFFVFGETILSPFWLAIPAAAFAGLVVIHARVVERLERARRAVDFYHRGIARLENQWIGAGQTGERFRNPAHVYQEDLDIFGKGSIFELLCTVRTHAGEDTLARWLLEPASREEAGLRQQAIAELRTRLDLREDLAVLGDAVRSGIDPEVAARWGEAPLVNFPSGAPFIAAALGVTVVVTFSLYMTSLLTRTPFLAALLLTLGYGFFLGSRTLQVAGAVNSPARDLAVLAKLLQRLESDHFDALLLQRLRQNLGASGLVASFQIGQLQRLVARLDWQRNLFFTPIAMAILWSAQIAMAIERWRKISGSHISEWISAVGEFEALFALAGYSYEHPHDSFPDLLDVAGGKLGARHGASTDERKPVRPKQRARRSRPASADRERL